MDRIRYKDGIQWVKADNRKLRRYLPILEMTKVKENFDQKLWESIKNIYDSEKNELGYMTFFHLKRLGIRRVFECIKAYYLNCPHDIMFQVNRAGQITTFKLLEKKKGREIRK